MTRKSILLFLTILINYCLAGTLVMKRGWGQNTPTVFGYVFLDENQSGVRDASEPGIVNVRVTDGYTIVQTDENGYYTFTTRDEYVITRIVIPSAFGPTTANGWFQRFDFTTQGDTANINFALNRSNWPEQISWWHTTDTHVDALNSNWGRHDATIRADVQQALSTDPAFVANTGDIVNVGRQSGDLVNFQVFRDYMAPLIQQGIPVFIAKGNNEDYPTPNYGSHKQPYDSRGFWRFMIEIGPLVFSHDIAGWHLIFIDNYDGSGGGSVLDDENDWRYQWLLEDLSLVPEGQPILFFTHRIRDGSSKSQLLERTLAGHNVQGAYFGDCHCFSEVPFAGTTAKSIGKRAWEEHFLIRQDAFYGRESEGLTTSVQTPVQLPKQFKLEQNYPNPFNPSTSICFWLWQQTFVKLEIHDIRGRVVRTLVNEVKSAGENTVVWDGLNDSGKSVANGIYFYSLKIDNNIVTSRKMLMLN